MQTQNNPPYMGTPGRPTATDSNVATASMTARDPGRASHVGWNHLPPENQSMGASSDPTSGSAAGEGGNSQHGMPEWASIVRGPDPKVDHNRPPMVSAADQEAVSAMPAPIGNLISSDYAGRIRL